MGWWGFGLVNNTCCSSIGVESRLLSSMDFDHSMLANSGFDLSSLNYPNSHPSPTHLYDEVYDEASVHYPEQ